VLAEELLDELLLARAFALHRLLLGFFGRPLAASSASCFSLAFWRSSSFSNQRARSTMLSFFAFAS
jgi:hypothetical protein